VNDDIFPKLFRMSQLPDELSFDAPQEIWMNFLKELSDIGKMNFVPLFKGKKFVPLSLELELVKLKSAHANSRVC
jgi:hypothetical protein